MHPSVLALCARQAGVVTRTQLTSLGLSDGAIRHALDSGRLVRMFPGAYRASGQPENWRHRATAACLIGPPGTAVSHRSAAKVWGLPLPPTSLAHLHVSVPGRHTVVLPTGIVAHRPRTPFRAVNIGAWAITTLARTVLDCAPELNEEQLECVLDSAHHRFPFFEHDLDLELQSFDARGNRPVTTIHRLLELRGGTATESPAETRVRRRLRASGLPPPRPQFTLCDGDEFLARVDFAWPLHRVALHVDGFTWHGQRRRFELDAWQRTRLAAMGWASLIVTSREAREDWWLQALTRVLEDRAPQLRLGW